MYQVCLILVAEEGYERRAYKKGDDAWTIGVGHNLQATGELEGVPNPRAIVWDDSRIIATLHADMARLMHPVYFKQPWLQSAPVPVQAVVTCMAFQLGPAGTLNFRNTLRYMQLGRWNEAASGMMASQWAKQTAARAIRMAQIIRTQSWLPWHATQASAVLKSVGLTVEAVCGPKE